MIQVCQSLVHVRVDLSDLSKVIAELKAAA